MGIAALHYRDRKQVRNIAQVGQGGFKCLVPLFCKIGMKE